MLWGTSFVGSSNKESFQAAINAFDQGGRWVHRRIDDHLGNLTASPRQCGSPPKGSLRVLQIPVIASGGIATGAGLVASLALGACAANMGTRFMATTEAPIHDNVKKQIVANTERDTVVVFRKFRNSARVVRNAISEKIVEISAREDATFADVADLAAGVRGRREVLGEGRMEDGMWWAGQSQGLVHDIDTTANVVARIIREAEELLADKLPKVVV